MPTAAQLKKIAEAEKAEKDRLESLYKARVLAGGKDGAAAIAELEKDTLERFALDEESRQKTQKELELSQNLLEKHEQAIQLAETQLAETQATQAEHMRLAQEQLEDREREIRVAADQLARTKVEMALATAELNQARRDRERAAQAPIQQVPAPVINAPPQPVNVPAYQPQAHIPPQNDQQNLHQAAIPYDQELLDEPPLSATFNVGDKYMRLYNGKKEEDARSHMDGYMDYVSNTLTAAPHNHPMRLLKLQIGRFRESLSGPARQ